MALHATTMAGDSVLTSFKLYQSAPLGRKTLLLELDEIVGRLSCIADHTDRETQRPALCCIVRCFVDDRFHQQQPYQ
jgi:hypothetical protein